VQNGNSVIFNFSDVGLGQTEFIKHFIYIFDFYMLTSSSLFFPARLTLLDFFWQKLRPRTVLWRGKLTLIVYFRNTKKKYTPLGYNFTTKRTFHDLTPRLLY